MQKSYFQNKTKIKTFPSINQDMQCDVLIVGGGIAGILTKRELDAIGMRTILCEKDSIGSHSSGKMMGKLAYIYPHFKMMEEKQLQSYIKLLMEAYLDFIRMIKEENIDCDLKIEPHYFIGEYYEVHEFYKKLEYLDLVKTELDSQDAFYVYPQAILDPIKLLKGLVENMEDLYENSYVEDYKKTNNGYEVLCNHHIIYCKHLVIATRFPIFFNYNLFRMSQTQMNLYLTNKHGKEVYYDITRDESRRYIDDYNIYMANTQKYIDMWWNQDTVTYDGLPMVGNYKDYYIITGFNGWGLVNAKLSSKLIKDLIIDKPNPATNLLDPFRLAIKASVVGLLTTSLRTITHYYRPNKKVCTHMGCRVCFNHKTHCYYCPCHGSVFDEYGNVIEGPAKSNLKR